MLRYQRPGKHPLSLWRDESIQPRVFEEDKECTDIFEIIMPWVADKAKEDRELDPARSSSQLLDATKTSVKGSSIQSKLSFGVTLPKSATPNTANPQSITPAKKVAQK